MTYIVEREREIYIYIFIYIYIHRYIYLRLYVSEDRTVCAVRLKNMKQRQSGHAVKGPAYGCGHVFMKFVYIIVQKRGRERKKPKQEAEYGYEDVWSGFRVREHLC